jgi:hypothetical protein
MLSDNEWLVCCAGDLPVAPATPSHLRAQKNAADDTVVKCDCPAQAREPGQTAASYQHEGIVAGGRDV